MSDEKTMGAVARDLMLKEPETRDPVEIQRATEEDYIKNLIECAEAHKKIFTHDFYIIVLTKNERLLHNVFRNFFYARISCPTPEYDQSVYRYNRHNDNIEYIWTVPSKEACAHLELNKNEVVESERGLLKFVLEFADGTLHNLAKKLNKEMPDSPLLAN
jgi:hypothetical protein